MHIWVPMHFGLHANWHVQFIDHGVVVEDYVTHNIWHAEGEQKVLQVLFDAATLWQTCYVGLDARPSLALADTYTIANGYKEDGTDYANVECDPNDAAHWVVAQDATTLHYKATSQSCTFTNDTHTDWQTNNNVFLFGSDEGGAAAQILISSAALATPRLLSAGQALSVQAVVVLYEE